MVHCLSKKIETEEVECTLKSTHSPQSQIVARKYGNDLGCVEISQISKSF